MTPAGIKLATFRSVTQYLNHCATAVPDIKIYLQEIDWKGVNWIHLVREMDKWTVMNLDVP